jgi:hypothetical protein
LQIFNIEERSELGRSKLDKHSLKILLYKKHAGKTIDPILIKEAVIECLPKEKFNERTWKTYSNRLTNYLIHTGFLARAGQSIVVQDSGAPSADRQEIAKRGKQRGKVFSASVSPYATVEAIDTILDVLMPSFTQIDHCFSALPFLVLEPSDQFKPNSLEIISASSLTVGKKLQREENKEEKCFLLLCRHMQLLKPLILL